ncbi:GDSL-type esterase/lipase family protein [Aeoliella mucimassa]|uniref:Multifunctional acyl-CoA thioesterase I and protease I and lysophospholipase L1 n=1 Tax=Aeoliella mucimassa TaxID=2527972 RepID=A0A518AGP5_9BACT|nr:GDSL-type esterase/lipase family protein [Aeoliella mucimassa]QDU53898.1 multifunctional acyl-CoA thioesterase I and protease I and lysophospholipase L1 [Aeoliella mucimassa]
MLSLRDVARLASCAGRAIGLLTLSIFLVPPQAGAQSSPPAGLPVKSALIQQLDAEQPQTIVVYGTSLTAGGAWVHQLSTRLNARYPDQITWVNAAMSGKASASGVANLDDRVLSKQPDAVFIEFGMNDAFAVYPEGNIDQGITVDQARANLEQMITRIEQQNPDAQVILQTMNPSWDAANGNQSGTKRPQLPDYYQMYREVAAERELLLIDNHVVWLTLQKNQPEEFAARVSDGTHPDSNGYQRFVTPAILHGLGADNALTLLVDVQSGRAVLHNQSATPLEFIGYTLSSPEAALSTSWTSLADQQCEGWHEASPSTKFLSELNPTESLSLASDATIDLGTAWNPSGALDLSFAYQTPDGVQHEGLVVYTTSVETMVRVAGDYNGDGQVNLADYTVWRDLLGASVAPGTAADGNRNGVIDSGDYLAWKACFRRQPSRTGRRTPATIDSVPEPATIALAMAATAMLPTRLLW